MAALCSEASIAGRRAFAASEIAVGTTTQVRDGGGLGAFIHSGKAALAALSS